MSKQVIRTLTLRGISRRWWWCWAGREAQPDLYDVIALSVPTGGGTGLHSVFAANHVAWGTIRKIAILGARGRCKEISGTSHIAGCVAQLFV